MIPLSKPWIGDEERAAVLRVLDSGMLAQGPEVPALEREWATACGAEHAAATSSGTTALHLALLAHGIGPGDEVITTPFSFVATVNAILHTGATPVFVDIEEDSFNLDASQLDAAVTPKTKAILPVHVFGQPCDLQAIDRVARDRGLLVIEDAAQAMGATFDGRKIGSLHTTCFSLYATKNVMAGEGGMITTSDADIAKRCRMLRSHGREAKEEPQAMGFNARMSELHAAIARVQLGRLADGAARRRHNAAALSAGLADVSAITRLPRPREYRDHVWHQYTVQLADEVDRDRLAARLRERGIGVGVFYRTPLHRLSFVCSAGARPERLEVAERVSRRVLSLPVHPNLTTQDLERVVEVFRFP